ncbi:MAG: hypothetical protein SGILL_003703 [Bacillariaceae sp.]
MFEVDLEGHLGAHRHEIVETRNRAGLFRRNIASRGSSDRLGLGYGKNNKQNSIANLLKNIVLCIQGSLMFVFGFLFGVKHPKRNFCIFLGLVAIVTGLVVGLRDDGSAEYIPAYQNTPAPLPKDTPAPTLAPQAVPVPVPNGGLVSKPTESLIGAGISTEAQRLKAVKDMLIQEGSLQRQVLENESSPQYLALKWIASVDGAQMEPSSPTFMLQRYALATLFFSTSKSSELQSGESVPDSTWNDQTNWMTGSGYCSWHGVACITGENADDNNQVVSLNLTSNGLSGVLPPEISLLSHLDHLDFSQNKLTDRIPTEIGTMANLRTLLLHQNSLFDSIPTEVGMMEKLRNLDLSENDLRGIVPSEIGRLSTLRGLVLDKNSYLGGNLPPLNSLSNLETLSVEQCRLQGTLPPALYLMTSLKRLRLQKNQFSGKLFPDLSRLSNLRK